MEINHEGTMFECLWRPLVGVWRLLCSHVTDDSGAHAFTLWNISPGVWRTRLSQKGQTVKTAVGIYLQFICYTGNGKLSQAHGTVILTIVDCNFEYSNLMRIFFIGNECLKPFTILNYRLSLLAQLYSNRKQKQHWASAMCIKSGQRWCIFVGHPRS